MIKQAIDWIIMKVLVCIMVVFVGLLLLPCLLCRAWVRIARWWLRADEERMEWYRKEIIQAFENKDWERAHFLSEEMMRSFKDNFNLF